MPNMILLCGIGTAVESARQKTWCRLERELPDILDLPCRTAFTSPFIRKKLAENGVLIPSPEEAMDELQGHDIFLQPLLLFDGEEYRKLASAAESRNIRTGKPIFTGKAAAVILEKLCEKYPAEEKRHILLVLHGSKVSSPEEELRAALSHLDRKDISPAVLTKEPPVFPAGTEKILLVPLMVTAGKHAARDIAGELEPKLRAMGFSAETVTEGLAEQEWFPPLIAELIRNGQ